MNELYFYRKVIKFNLMMYAIYLLLAVLSYSIFIYFFGICILYINAPFIVLNLYLIYKVFSSTQDYICILRLIEHISSLSIEEVDEKEI